jgi:fatty acid desaturase
MSPNPVPSPKHDLFLDELDALGRQLRADLTAEDLAHLRRIERWGRTCTALGWSTAWLGPNPVSAYLLSQGRFTRWTTVAHHVSHGGYARVPGVPRRYTPSSFAKGARRFVDWFDVIRPEGWHAEHNRLHHTRTGDEADPDLVEQNLEWLRKSELPRPVKLLVVGAMAATWKWMYYAPNTLQEALAAEAKARGETFERTGLRDPGTWDPRTEAGHRLWVDSFLPYALWHFVLAPSLFLPLGPLAVASAAANSAMAEILTNLHSFLVIVTNHAGDDLFAFEGPPANRSEFVRRQITGSVDFATGDDPTDFLHGWLNYQIEHHVWPDLTMLQYRKAQPRLKALCEKHGIPYVQESVWRRLRKTTDIMVGTTSMRRTGSGSPSSAAGSLGSSQAGPSEPATT